jgi:alkylhydroperoxidase family enzyme
MAMTMMAQGPWTRIRPLQIDEVDVKTAAAMKTGELTRGGLPNNLVKVMAYCPRFVQLELEYANSFMVDPVTLVGDLQTAGFNDRFLKELVILRTSLLNRSHYSVTHHCVVAIALFNDAGRGEEGHRKLLYLDEHDNHRDVYTERERVVLDYTTKVSRDAHTVTDHDFADLRSVLAAHNGTDARLTELDDAAMARHVDSQIVELTWLIGHFCLLNRWFTVLQVPDEGPLDEADFVTQYEQVVPADIRERNARILGGSF